MKLLRKILSTQPTAEEEDRLMLEMEYIGKKIASLRKKSNMTQQELADQMSVTYQAVSNWERGLSLPDVIRLKELARLYKVSLDELMGSEEATRVVEVAAGDRPVGSVGELLESAPYMKPRKLEEEIRARTSPAQESGKLASPQTESPEPDISVSADTTGKDPSAGTDVFESTGSDGPVEGDLSKRLEDIQKEKKRAAFFPAPDGADREDRETSAEDENSQGISYQNILTFAPFVSSELLHDLLREEITSDPGADMTLLIPLSPFLEQEHLKDLAELCLKEGGVVSEEVLTGLMPHLDQETLAELFLTEGLEISEATLLSLLPHLDQEALGELARRTLVPERSEPHLLITMAPFLDPDTLGTLVLSADGAKTIPDSGILTLAPFMEEEDLKTLVENRDEILRDTHDDTSPLPPRSGCRRHVKKSDEEKTRGKGIVRLYISPAGS